MKSALQSRKRGRLRFLHTIASTTILVLLAIALPIQASAQIQTIGVSLYDPARAWKFSSSIMTVYSLNVTNKATNAVPVESDNYFFPSVPRIVMDQVPNADFYYSVPYKTNYARFQVLWQTSSVTTNFTDVYLNVPIEQAVILPLQTFQVWLRVHYCDCSLADPINPTVLDSINYIKQVSNGSYYFTPLTLQTDQAGNVWQCFEFKNTSSNTISFGGLTILLHNDNPKKLYHSAGFVDVSLELGPMLLGFLGEGSNSIKSQRFWNDATALGILNDQTELQEFYTGLIFTDDPNWDDPTADIVIPDYNLGGIVGEDDAIDNADEALDDFLDDIGSGQFDSSIDFFQYIFRKIGDVAGAAIITGGTVVFTVFKALFGR